MNKFLIIISLLALNSCFLLKEKGINFEIKNNSDLAIENVKFYTSEKLDILEFKKIKSNYIVKRFLSMANNKIDGSYILEYNRIGGQTKIYSRGYYTNGKPLDKLIQFEIKNDTTLVNFLPKPY